MVLEEAVIHAVIIPDAPLEDLAWAVQNEQLLGTVIEVGHDLVPTVVIVPLRRLVDRAVVIRGIIALVRKAAAHQHGVALVILVLLGLIQQDRLSKPLHQQAPAGDAFNDLNQLQGKTQPPAVRVRLHQEVIGDGTDLVLEEISEIAPQNVLICCGEVICIQFGEIFFNFGLYLLIHGITSLSTFGTPFFAL